MTSDFFVLFEKLSPLFLLILTGFFSAKFLHVTRESIAKLVIYVISPIVFFDILTRSPFRAELAALPFAYGALCSLIAVLTYILSKEHFRSPHRNLLAYSAGSANTGYFGIPATLVLLGEDKLSTAIFIIIGYNLYEFTTGFYLAARGSFDSKEAFKKIIKLPALWSFFLALFFSFMGWNKIPPNLDPILTGFRGAYSTLGLMMIGLGLGSIKSFKLHYKFIFTTLFIKLFIFPLMACLFVWIDANTTHLLDHSLREIFMLMSLVPLAANGVSIATELRLPTDEMAFTITCSTLIALLWIPLCWSVWVISFLNQF